MGLLKKLNQWRKQERLETKFAKLVRECDRLSKTEPLSSWQKDRIKEIRALGEFKCKVIDDKAREAKMGIVEEFMQFEIDFIYASQKFKTENPGREMRLIPEESGFRGMFSGAFFRSLIGRSKRMGIVASEEEKEKDAVKN